VYVHVYLSGSQTHFKRTHFEENEAILQAMAESKISRSFFFPIQHVHFVFPEYDSPEQS